MLQWGQLGLFYACILKLKISTIYNRQVYFPTHTGCPSWIHSNSVHHFHFSSEWQDSLCLGQCHSSVKSEKTGKKSRMLVLLPEETRELSAHISFTKPSHKTANGLIMWRCIILLLEADTIHIIKSLVKSYEFFWYSLHFPCYYR